MTASVLEARSAFRDVCRELMMVGNAANARNRMPPAASHHIFFAMFLSRVGSTFKNAEQMSVPEVDRIWSNLQQGFQQILTDDATSLSFEELYRSAYNMVIHKHGPKLHDGLTQVIRAHLANRSKIIASAADAGALLVALSREWDHHKKVMRMLRDVLMYVDRNFATQFNKPSTIDVGLNLFQTCIMSAPALGPRIMKALMDAIDDHRRARTEDTTLVRSIISIFHETSQGKECADLWSSVLLPTYQARAEEYYKHYSAESSRSLSGQEFVKSALFSYSFESDLLRTFPHIIEATHVDLNKAFIAPYHEQVLKTVFIPAVDRDDRTSVKEIFALFSKTESSKRCMLVLFREYLINDLQSPFDINNVVVKLRKIKGITATCLGKEFFSDLQSTLEALFSTTTEICQKLSLFLDDAIKQVAKGGDETDTKFEEAMGVLQLVSSKDAFEAYYRFHLGRRLLASKSVISVEQAMAQKLRQECGQSYTTKIDGMINDVVGSGDLATAWRTHDSVTADVFEARILTTSVWSNLQIVDLKLASNMAAWAESFRAFYCAKFSGRKLTWIHSQGSVDLRRCDSQTTLSVSTIQAVVLLLFNDHNTVTLEQMLKQTGLSLSEAKRHILSLFVNQKCQILTKSGNSKNLQELTDTFSLNCDFDPKTRHVKVPLLVDLSVPEVTGGSTGDLDTGAGVEQTVHEDRKHLIEAAIVRIMKLKRQLDHNGLIVELASHLGNRFIPSMQMIKERVENLIDREFIARDNDDVKLYYYVA